MGTWAISIDDLGADGKRVATKYVGACIEKSNALEWAQRLAETNSLRVVEYPEGTAKP